MIDPAYMLAGAVTGFVVGTTGVGGGALMTPILLFVFGVTPVTAVATDLWFAVITKVAGAAVHQKTGEVDWTVVRKMWTGSLPAAALCVLAVCIGAPLGRIGWLSQLVGILVLMTAIGLLLSPWLHGLARDRRIAEPERFKASQGTLTVVTGGVLGLCVALTSIGSGSLGTVALRYLYPFRMTPHRLVATDIVHAIPLAAVAGVGYLFAGKVNTAMLISLLAGSLPAVILGSMTARHLAGRWLQVGIALVLAASGLKAFV